MYPLAKGAIQMLIIIISSSITNLVADYFEGSNRYMVCNKSLPSVCFCFGFLPHFSSSLCKLLSPSLLKTCLTSCFNNYQG